MNVVSQDDITGIPFKYINQMKHIHKIGNEVGSFLDRLLTIVRILVKDTGGSVIMINPTSIPHLETLGDGRAKTLGFDPKVWKWYKIGSLQEMQFYDYRTEKEIILVRAVFENNQITIVGLHSKTMNRT